MKILAIRGRNLASLAGDFEVDLEAAPLGEAGLFAISGPTGAGKTTLLDAMCLALFDRTPRLSHVSSRANVRVGLPEEDDALWVAAHDVRSMLRKGTSGGQAEVDFLGRDGGRYRARWTVRRARDRADGKLQAQAMSLCSLESPDRAIGRTKEEVLAEIERRLGLSFEQFRRSALLAQGEFAAFLRADERERAELLEQMTGTWVYGELSVRAFERARAEARGLEEIEARAREVSVLEGEARAELERAASMGEQLVRERHERLGAAEAARAYYRALAHLEEQERAAREQLGQARAALEVASPRAAALERARAAQAIRPSVDRHRAASARLDEADAALARLEDQVLEASMGEEAAVARAAEAEARLAETRAELDRMAPELERAGRLDERVKTAELLLVEAEREWERARRDASEASARSVEASRGVEGARAARAEALAEIEKRAHVAALAAEWDKVRLELRRFVEIGREMARVDRPGAARRASASLAAEAEAGRSLRAAEQALAEEQQRLEEAEAQAGGFDRPAMRAQMERALTHASLLAELGQCSDEAREAASGRALAVEAAEQAEAEAAAYERQADDASRKREVLEAALAEASSALFAARAALDLSTHRAELTPGAPCPLCGSEEHPWAREAPALSELFERQQQRVDELSSMARLHEREEATGRSKARELSERTRAEMARALRLEALLGQIQSRWSSLRSLVGADLPESGWDERAPEALSASRAMVAQAIERLRAQDAEADRCEREVAGRRASRDRARSLSEQSGRASLAAQAEARAAAEALARADDALAQGLEGRRCILEEVAPAFDGLLPWSGWRERVEADAVEFGKACLREVTDHRSLAERARSAEASLSQLEPLRAAAAARAEELGSAAASRGEQRARRRAERDAAAAERRAIFGGRPTDLVNEALSVALAAAEAEARAASAGREGAGRLHASLSGELLASRARRGELLAELLSADQALSASLAEAGLGRDEIAALLARDSAWLRDEALALEQLRAAEGRCEAVLAERIARRLEHEREGRPGASAGEVEQAIAEARRALDEAEEALTTTRVRLRDDDRERGRATQLAEQLSRQRARAELWGGLSQLIGSADGKKFRVFAQSLTFDALIALANVHLAELARRYQLMRVPRTDLDLQVIDREMADEARSVGSLSGGETFLVSLALALGLSSLGSRDTRVETLFIDEGFGTLDPDALEVALSALDALQGAGRQVGLISHVPGLADRLAAQVRVQPCGAGRSTVVVRR